jgi:hypothetical protein
MKLLLMLLLFLPSDYFECENKCRAKRTRCEQRCADENEVGSMDHLKCNERCREDFMYCRKEEC